MIPSNLIKEGVVLSAPKLAEVRTDIKEELKEKQSENLFNFTKPEFNELMSNYGLSTTTATMIAEINNTLPEGSDPLIYEELKSGVSPYLITSEEDLKKPKAQLAMSDEDMLVNFSNVKGFDKKGVASFGYSLARAFPEAIGAGMGMSAAAALTAPIVAPHPLLTALVKSPFIIAGGIFGAIEAGRIEDELIGEPDPTVPSMAPSGVAGETAAFILTPSSGFSGPVGKLSKSLGKNLKKGSETLNAKAKAEASRRFNRKTNPDGEGVNKALTATQFLKQLDVAKKTNPEQLDDFLENLLVGNKYKNLIKKSVTTGSGKAPLTYRAAGFIEKAASDFTREAAERPLYFLGKEAVYGTGAALGAYVSQVNNPYSETSRVLTEILGAGSLGSIAKRSKDAASELIDSRLSAIAADTYSGKVTPKALKDAFMKKTMAKGVNRLDKKGVKRFIDLVRSSPEFAPDVDDSGKILKTTNEKIGEFFDEMGAQAKVRSANEVERLKKEIDIDRKMLETESLDSTTIKEIQKDILEKQEQIDSGIKVGVGDLKWENEDWTKMATGYSSVFKGFEKYLKTKTAEGRAIEANTLLKPIYMLVSQGDRASLSQAAVLMRSKYKADLENILDSSIQDLFEKSEKVLGGSLSKSSLESSERLYKRVQDVAEAADKHENQLWENVDNYAILNFKKDVVEDFTPISGNNRLAAMVAGEPDPQDLPNIVKVLKGKEFSDADTREGLGGMSQQLQEMVEFFTLSNKDEAVIRQYRKDVESYRKLLAKKENPPKGETFTKADGKALVGLKDSKGRGKLASAESKMAEMVLRLDQANSVRSVLSNTNSADQALSVIGTESKASKYMSVKDARKEYPLMADKLVRLRSQLLTKARNLRAGASIPKNAALAKITDNVTEAILKDLDLGEAGERAAYDLARNFSRAKFDVFARTFLNKVKSKARTGKLTMHASDLVDSVFRGSQSSQINNIEALESAAEFLIKEGVIEEKDFAKYTTTDLVNEAFRTRLKPFFSEVDLQIKGLDRPEKIIAVKDRLFNSFKNKNSDLLEKFGNTSVYSNMDDVITAEKFVRNINNDPINSPSITAGMVDKAVLNNQPEIAEALLGRLGLQEIQKENPTKALILAMNSKRPVAAIKSLLYEIDKATPKGKKLKITQKDDITGETTSVEVGNKELRKAFTSSIFQAAMETSDSMNGKNIDKLIGFLKRNIPGLDKNTDYSLLDLMVDQKLIKPKHKVTVEQALKAFNEADTAYKTNDYQDLLFSEPSATKMLGLRLAGATAGTMAQQKLKQAISKLFGFNFGMSGGFIAEQAGSQFLRNLLVDGPSTVGNRRLAMLFSDAEALAAFGKALKDSKPAENLGILQKAKKYIMYIPPFGVADQLPRSAPIPTTRYLERDLNDSSDIEIQFNEIQPNTTSSVNSPRASNIRPNPVRQVATGPVTSPTTNPTAVGIQGSITPESAQRFAQVFGANDSVLTMGIGGLVR